jgi:hypothetical protein
MKFFCFGELSRFIKTCLCARKTESLFTEMRDSGGIAWGNHMEE